MSMSGVKRPALVTLIGVILYIQAFLAAVAAIVGLAFNDRLDDMTVNGVEITRNSVIWTSIIEGIMAIILFLVAAGLMRGSAGYRMVVAIVEGIRIISAFGLMLFHHGGAYVEGGIVSIAISLFVLWALYNEKADAFFERSV